MLFTQNYHKRVGITAIDSIDDNSYFWGVRIQKTKCGYGRLLISPLLNDSHNSFLNKYHDTCTIV